MRYIFRQRASFIRPDVCVLPKTDPAAYDWAIAFPPSACAIRKIIAKTCSLLDKRANDLSAALAILECHVVRTDGHFDVHREIITKAGAGAMICTHAYIVGTGFLLKEVPISASESRANYIGGMERILLATGAAGYLRLILYAATLSL